MEALADWIASEAITNCSTHNDILYGLISRQAEPTDDRAVVDAIKKKLSMVMGDDPAVWLAISWNNEIPQGATITSICLGPESEASLLAASVHSSLVSAYNGHPGLVSDDANNLTHNLKEWDAAADEPKLLEVLFDAIRNKPSSTSGSGAAAGDSARPTPPPGALSIDQFLAQERSKFTRLSPTGAYHAISTSGSSSTANAPFSVLIDIRPAAQRLVEGEIPGALVIERNVLEWRVDPQANSRLREPRGIADRYDNQIIVFCSEGYTSSLAAAALLVLGLSKATDIEGGFVAWKAAGLPTVGGQANL